MMLRTMLLGNEIAHMASGLTRGLKRAAAA
jgi:hypothetical protein